MATAPPPWRQVAVLAAALLVLLATAAAAAAAASDAAAKHLADAKATGATPVVLRRQLLASGSVGAGGIAGAEGAVHVTMPVTAPDRFMTLPFHLQQAAGAGIAACAPAYRRCDAHGVVRRRGAVADVHEQMPWHLTDSPTLAPYIAGVVVGMALLAAAVGGLCFALGRRSARAAGLTIAAGAAGDIEVRCRCCAAASARWMFTAHVGLQQMRLSDSSGRAAGGAGHLWSSRIVIVFTDGCCGSHRWDCLAATFPPSCERPALRASSGLCPGVGTGGWRPRSAAVPQPAAATTRKSHRCLDPDLS
jgi:hypothetical protein